MHYYFIAEILFVIMTNVIGVTSFFISLEHLQSAQFPYFQGRGGEA